MKVKIPESWRFWQDSEIPIQIRKAIDTIPNRVGPLAIYSYKITKVLMKSL